MKNFFSIFEVGKREEFLWYVIIFVYYLRFSVMKFDYNF